MSNRWYLLLLIPIASFSQGWGGREGEIPDTVFVFQKDKEITMPPMPRSFDKVPPLPIIQEDKADLTYSFSGDLPVIPYSIPRVRALAIQPEALDKLYGNYIRFGAGNYGNTLFRGYFTNKRSKTTSAGLLFTHDGFARGVVDGANSGFNQQRIYSFYKYRYRNFTASVTGDYQRWSDRLFGYDSALVEPPDREDITFNTHLFQLHGEIENNNKRYWDIHSGANFFYFTNSSLRNNTGGSLDFDLLQVKKTGLSFFMKGSAYSDQVTDSVSSNRALIKILPGASFKLNNLQASAGVRLVYQSDTLENTADFVPYPFASIKYQVNETFLAKAKIEGNVEAANLPSLTNLNRLMASQTPVHFQTNGFHIEAEADARLHSRVSTRFGFSFSSVKNMAFVVKDTEDTTAFTLLYDKGNIGLVNFWGNIVASPLNDLEIEIEARYLGYDMDLLQEAWYRPNLVLEAALRYQLQERFLLQSSIIMLDGIVAPGITNPVLIDPVIHWELASQYKITSRFSAHLRFANMLNMDNQQFLAYPQPGFNINAGISYKF